MTDLHTEAEQAEHDARWRREAQREAYRWRYSDQCRNCGEWVGHFGGSPERGPCPLIPLNVQLEEVRPNCVTVRRYRIGDAIRAATEPRTQRVA